MSGTSRWRRPFFDDADVGRSLAPRRLLMTLRGQWRMLCFYVATFAQEFGRDAGKLLSPIISIGMVVCRA